MVHKPDVHPHKIQICLLTAYIIYNTIHKYTHAVRTVSFHASLLRVSNWILTSTSDTQGHPETTKLCHKQIHISKLF